MHRYSPEIEEQMDAFYQSLSEKDRRRYAAIEACKLGRGGLSYMARVLSCDRHTIAQGVQELADAAELQRSGIRRTGGGRKRSQEILPGLDAAFLQVVEHHTAGSPMNAAVKWTNLTRQEIVNYLATEHGITISVTVVKQLLREHDFVRRKAQKRRRTGECAQRDAQFAKIAELKEAYTSQGKPIVSMDTKKKN
jgi:DDE family transposase/winged helix-turn-helix protein